MTETAHDRPTPFATVLRSWQVVALLSATLTMGLTAGVFGDWAHTVMPGLGAADDRTVVGAFLALDRAILNPLPMFTFMGALVFTGAAALLYLREVTPLIRSLFDDERELKARVRPCSCARPTAGVIFDRSVDELGGDRDRGHRQVEPAMVSSPHQPWHMKREPPDVESRMAPFVGGQTATNAWRRS